jgi:hypothetical protein
VVSYAIPLATCAVGAFLLARGLWGKRVGHEPRCAECQYELTGLTSERCPECGTTVSPGRVVLGSRQLRRGSAVAGGIALLAGVMMLTAWLRKADWYYQYAPFRCLLFSAKRGDDGALDALAIRCMRREASMAQLELLARACIDKQAEDIAAGTSKHGRWLFLFWTLDREGRLPAPLRRRFYGQAITVSSFDVPESISVGDPLAGKLCCRQYAPLPTFPVVLSEHLRIDGGAVPRYGIGHGPDGVWLSGSPRPTDSADACSEWCIDILVTPPLSPGSHQVEYGATLGLSDHRDVIPDSSKEITVRREFEVRRQDE